MKTTSDVWITPQIKHNELTQWNWMVAYPESLTLGKKVDIGVFTYIQAKGGVIIEDNVQIGSHCSIYSVDTIDDWEEPIHLKKGCCIGSHSVILPGVIIDEDVKIKAHSLLTKGRYYYQYNIFNCTNYVIKENIGICEKKQIQRW